MMQNQNIQVSGYVLEELIYQSGSSLVYRGVRSSDGREVIIKKIKEAYPSAERLAWFRREFNLNRELDIEEVVEVLDIESTPDGHALIFEDFGGQSLEKLTQENTLNFTDKLFLFLEATRILAKLHAKNLVHRDISPGNFIYNLSTKKLKIIDLGIASFINTEKPVYLEDKLEGTLAYISPEQTGRINRQVDHRSDLYGLGATFYQMFLGRPPFEQKDPMNLIFSHIVKRPAPPIEIDTDMPAVLSDILLKLLEKQMEDRYHSAFGLSADLQRCYDQWIELGRIDAFKIGARDIHTHFHIPQRLYGRENEVDTLLRLFRSVSLERKTKIVWIQGYSGIGKSALVHELYRPLTMSAGFFIEGKFDQFQRDVPYAPIIGAIRSLLRHLLTASETELSSRQWHLKQRLQEGGSVLAGLIPELGILLDTKAADPSESGDNRQFKKLIKTFLQSFTQYDEPIALFLDDLQWADDSSLELIESLAEGDCGSLFLIGAYRDNEVDKSHPLSMVLDRFQEHAIDFETIKLAPLMQHDVVNWLQDMLHQRGPRVSALATLVQVKTGGNPFFIKEFMRSLYNQKLVRFEDSHWVWDTDKIRAQNISSNVADLVARAVGELPDETRELLHCAAVMGGRFDLDHLAKVVGRSRADTAGHLWHAIQQQWIIPLNREYKVAHLDIEGLDKAVEVTYKFAHDRVHQTIFNAVPDKDRTALHLRIGRSLSDQGDLERHCFKIANHMNQAVALVDATDERKHLQTVNFMAGRKATSAAAHDQAFDYYRNAISLFDERAWLDHYEETLAHHIEATRSAYNGAYFENMGELAQIVYDRGRTLPEKISAYEIHIEAYHGQNRSQEALDLGLSVLENLGVVLKPEADHHDLVEGAIAVRAMHQDRNMRDIVSGPPATDPMILAAQKLMTSLLWPAYGSAPQLYPQLVCKQMELIITDGPVADTPSIMAHYASVLCNYPADYDTGLELAELALDLLDGISEKKTIARTLHLYCLNIAQLKAPLRDAFGPYRQALHAAMEIGDLEVAGLDAVGIPSIMYLCGVELPELHRECDHYLNVFRSLGNHIAKDWLLIFQQAVQNLMDQNEDPVRISGAAFREEDVDPAETMQKNPVVLFYVSYHKMTLGYIFGDLETAKQQDAILQPFYPVYCDLWISPPMYFFACLIKLAACEALPADERTVWLEQVDVLMQKMKTWAETTPVNFSHRYHLVLAERYRILGEPDKAAEHYDIAVEQASANHYLNDEALAYELAGKFHLQQGRRKVAAYYLRDALYSYDRWGAKAKTEAMSTLYKDLWSLVRIETTNREVSAVHSVDLTNQALDMASVVKAGQHISQEIRLDKLLSKLLHILLENAGAQRGLLILREDQDWMVTAAGHYLDEQLKVDILSEPVKVDQFARLPHKIFNYVVKTEEEVVLDEAAKSLFADDPYFESNPIQSVICTLLFHQGKPRGVIYLENRHAGVFVTQRIEILKMLSSQTAISLENARLYSGLEQKVAERTSQLQRQNEELETLDEIVKTLNNQLGLKELLNTLLEQGMTLFPWAEQSFFLLRQRIQDRFTFEATLGVDERKLRLISFDEETLKSRYFNKSENIGRGVYLLENPTEKHFDALPGVGVPNFMLIFAVEIEDQLTGLMLFERLDQRHQFERGDLAKALRFNEHAVSALIKANLLQQLEKKNKEMISSIRYARNIQVAFLPDETLLTQLFPHNFVLYLPRDWISGDFYWCVKTKAGPMLAVADCTGHGVPGAIISAIGHQLLNKVVVETGETDPGFILENLHIELRSALKQDLDDTSTMDGMEVCLCLFPNDQSVVRFAGAGRPLYQVRDGRVNTIKGSRKPIGGRQKEKRRIFETHEIVYQSGDALYLCSDGYVDQPSQEQHRFGSPRFRELLKTLAILPVSEQKKALNDQLQSFCGDIPQRDDITVVGLKIP